MALCKYCGRTMNWGYVEADGRWVGLVPKGEEGALDREYQDSDGNLRSGHRLICPNGAGAVRVSRLARSYRFHEIAPPVTEHVDPETGEILPGPGPLQEEQGSTK